jgi:hypothetical protein
VPLHHLFATGGLRRCPPTAKVRVDEKCLYNTHDKHTYSPLLTDCLSAGVAHATEPRPLDGGAAAHRAGALREGHPARHLETCREGAPTLRDPLCST